MTQIKSKRYHIIFDACGIETKYLDNKQDMENLLKEICSLIDMKILYGPTVIEGIPENPGLSAFCIIDYSHISIHTFTETNEFCIDVFSCKPFDQNLLKNYLIEKFETKPENFIFKQVIDIF